MYNFKAKFDKILDICKHFSKDLVNNLGNVPRRGVVPVFSDYAIDGGENYFCIDSKPVEVCRISRAKRCKIGKDNYETAPSYGCSSQRLFYYGYKLYALCGLNGVIQLGRLNMHYSNTITIIV